MKKKQYDDDDGRKIADMSDININTLGFGYVPRRRRLSVSKPENNENIKYPDFVPLTKEETRFMMFKAMLAALGIAMVFIIGAALFILFCIYIWF